MKKMAWLTIVIFLASLILIGTVWTQNHQLENELTALKSETAIEAEQQKTNYESAVSLLQNELAAAEEDAIEEQEKVIRVKRYAAKPMSVDDAILEMDLLGHSFYMFSNIETGNAATVYRRTDGGCGLIELENL